MKYFLLQFAQKISAGGSGIPTGTEDDLLRNGLNLTYFLAGVITIITIVVAGIMYITSTGDTGRITKAKNVLTYAIVGLIIILCAFTITNFVLGRF
ncbi:MAG: hypothetical protein WAR37_02420 [Candidatus Microsaccharimonas sp.]